MIVKNEYIYNYPKLNEIKDIINNTLRDYKNKYGGDYIKIDFKYNIQFYDKIKNKYKNVTTTHGVERTLLASNGRYEYDQINKFTIIVEKILIKFS